MSRVRWQEAGAAGGRRRVENLALVPGSLLPHKATYQRLADDLPPGTVLIVLPVADTVERRTLQLSAERLRAKGHRVVTLSADDVLGHAADRMEQTAVVPAVPAAPSLPSAPRLLEEPVTTTDVPAATTAPPMVPEPAATTPASSAPVIDVPPFTRELRLVSIDGSRNRARFYLLQWLPTLWGGVALVRVWGRIGRPGRSQVLLETAAPSPSPALVRLVRQRVRHGYRVVDWQ